MAFKLGKESRKYRTPDNTQIIKKKLDEGILAEANMDGTIFVSDTVDLNTPEGKRAVNHEMQHITDMKTGRSTYTDDYVLHDGQMWPRLNGYILDPFTGKKYEEGSRELPWEKNKI